MRIRYGLASFLLLSLLGACVSDGDDTGSTVADAANATPADAAGGGGAADARVDTTPDAGLNLADARPSALACAGDSLPTVVASPPVVISGTVQEGSASGITTMTQVAHVSAHQRADDTILTEGDFTGPYSLTDPTNSTTPIDAYLKATSNGYIDTYVYPPAAITENLVGTPIVMIETTIFGLLPLLTGVTQADGNGVLLVAVVDCEQSAVEGATVSLTPDVGELRYAGANGLPSMTIFPATQSPGVAYIFNVPPGEYQVNATAPDGTLLRTTTVKSYADSNTTSVIAP